MSKIKVSAVKTEALAEAIILNSSFVAKAVRAADVAKSLKHLIKDNSTRFDLDENGNRKLDEKGEPITILEVGKSNIYIYDKDVIDVYNRLIPFVEELCEALIGEEK